MWRCFQTVTFLTLWIVESGFPKTVDASSSAASQWTTVQTSNGPIRGHPAANRTRVLEYLGIPYAKPPLGDLRFAPPQKLTDHKPYEALNFGFDCPLTASSPVNYPGFTPQAQRVVNYFASGAGNPQSEDCLTLNVWSRPTSKSKKAEKPVLVFFYGGRFNIGNTNTPFYNGKYFADAQDIIVVTVNYRLNIFGFPGAPGEAQNVGLGDQRVAVEWIRDNIAAFGGSPKKITLSGQSAGGVAVDYWSYAHKQDPVAHGLIAQSGNAFSFPLNNLTVREGNWNTVVQAVNCSSTPDVLSCMRSRDWKAIEMAAAKVKAGRSTSVLRSIPPFYPTVDNKTVFSDYNALNKAGSFSKLPLLLGNCNNEDGYYRIPAFANNITATAAQAASFILESFTCPNALQAHIRTAAAVPVWRYRYFGDWSNVRLYPTSGAYHGTDLEMMFGTSEDVSGIPPSKAEEKTTRLMQRAWAAFCEDPVDGLSTVMKWPRYDPDGKSLVRLALDNNPKPEFVRPEVYDAPCANVTLGALATLGGASRA